MELVETNICPNCGGKLEEKNGQYYCLYCGKGFREEDIAEKSEEVKKELGGVVADELIKQRMEDIANARRNLYAAIHEEYIDNNKVLQYSREVKKYLSDDVQASFYETAVSSNAKAINKFLDNIDAEKYDYLAPDIIEFMLKSLEKSNILTLENFIERVYKNGDEKFAEYRTRIDEEGKKLDEGIYNPDIPRDVFLAYSSADWRVVNEITEYLEENELHCFVALRNLRHGKGAVENYRNYLERAMHNCKCFVFISTENSCSLDCDALKVELPYMRDREPNKGRIEYASNGKRGKMTDAARMLVNEFFGVEYCTNKEDVLKRVLEKITTKKVVKAQTEKYCKACGTKNYLNAKICCECGNKDFVNTYEEYARIKAEEQVRKEYAEKEEQARKEREALAAKAEQERIARERIKQEAEKEKSALAAELERMKAELETAKTIIKQCDSKVDFEIENGVLKKYKGSSWHIVIPDGVTSIGDEAFCDCSNLSSVEIPNGVTSIGNKAFWRCSRLSDINIPNGVTSIGNEAFFGCLIKNIVIPNSVINIGQAAFSYCKYLTSIILPDCVTSIGRIFQGCKNLINVTIPNSVTSIGNGAFCDCSSLTSITIPNGVTSIGNDAFRDCSSLTSITIPNSVTSIGDLAFCGCHNLISIEIPNSVTSIGNGAFYGCSKNLIIKCNAEEQPSGWHKDWNKKWNGILSGRYKVIWGYKG